MSEDSSKTEVPEIGESESLHSSLDEIRRRYDDEERRRVAIESKISGLLALNTLLISVVTGLPGEGYGHSRTLAQIILLISALLSFSVLVFGYKFWGKHCRPLQHPGQIYSKAQKSESEFIIDFLGLYASCLKNNEYINDQKRSFLAFNFLMTGLGIGVILVGSGI